MMNKTGQCFLLFAILLVLAACAGEDKKVAKLKIGDPAPDFAVSDLAGRTVSLAAFRGQPVVLRFWSTDCKYCRADTPIFNRYFEKYKERGLRVIYVNRNSDEATVRQFVADLEIPFPVVLDRDGAISASYNIKMEPQTIFISPRHTILAAVLGGVSEGEFQNLLGGYLRDPREGN
ncbi:peroxiredoxin family protein [Thiovibrio sp. JS02]